MAPGRLYGLAALLSAAFVTWIVYRTAWVSDDAYITFRSVEQVFAGHGPRWNAFERVQAFTHPLWFGLLLIGRLFTSDLFLASIVISLVLTAAVVLTAAASMPARLPSLAVLTALLVSSQAFVDFSTSGLEGPLLFLCIAALFLATARAAGGGSPAPAFVAAGLAWLCRPDIVWLVGPAVAWAAWRYRKEPRVLAGALAAGAALPAMWLTFSLAYYGTLVPNTALAKLNIGVPAWALVNFGLHYAINLLQWDPVTALVIVAAAAWAFAAREPLSRAWALGLVLHAVYVISIGGDFMSGRFFAPAFVVGALMLSQRMTGERPAAALVAGAIVFGLFWSTAPLRFDLATYPTLRQDSHSVADEKSFYRSNFFEAWRALHGRFAVFPQHELATFGNAFRFGGEDVKVQGNIGMYGYWAGTDKTIVDGLALSDALLARLPTTTSWRVGHYPRRIPAGYLESIRAGTNVIEDPAVHELYDLVRLQTQGAFFDPARWAAIFKLNVGAYPRISPDYR